MAKNWLKKYQKGGALSPENAAISKVLMERNRGKNFVDRAFDAGYIQQGEYTDREGRDLLPIAPVPNSAVARYPLIPLKDDGYMSHFMGEDWGQSASSYGKPKYKKDPKTGRKVQTNAMFEGPYRVYPTVVQDKSGNIMQLDDNQAYDYADETGEYINAPTQHIASMLANKGYKKATGIPTYKTGGTVGNYWEELSKAKYGQNMLNMTDEQIAMVRDTNRVTDDPLMIPGLPRVKAQSGTKVSSKGYKKNSPDKNEPMLTIPSNRITMQDVDHPVMAYPSTGKGIMMHPGGEYYFPHADYVTEVFLAQNGWSSSDLAKLREANANYKPSPYQDMDPAMLQQYRENQRVMQLAATPQGKVQLKKEAEDKKYANKKKQEVARDKQTAKDLQESYARDRFNADPSVVNPEYWQTDPQTGRTPQQRLDDMGTDLQTSVFRGGTDFIDNLNPGVWIAGMAGNLAKAPLKTQQENSYMPYVSAIGEPLAYAIGEELAAPYIKKMFGKTPVNYGESNVPAPDGSSVDEFIRRAATRANAQSITKEPVPPHPNYANFKEPYPNEPGSITPATGNKAATLVEVPTLNKQQEILQSFGLDPYKTKAEEELVSLYRAQPVGQNPDMNMAAQLKAKIAAGKEVPFYANDLIRRSTSTYPSDANIYNREQTYGRWFDKNPSRLKHYLEPGTSNFEEGVPLEILKYDLPKSEAMKYNVANFPGPNTLSLSSENEFILPKELIEKAQRYPASDWQKLIDQHKAWGLLPAGFTIAALKSAMSQQDTKQYGGKIKKNWLQNY